MVRRLAHEWIAVQALRQGQALEHQERRLVLAQAQSKALQRRELPGSALKRSRWGLSAPQLCRQGGRQWAATVLLPSARAAQQQPANPMPRRKRRNAVEAVKVDNLAKQRSVGPSIAPKGQTQAQRREQAVERRGRFGATI